MKVELSDVGIAAVRLLEALSASADFNPILKSAAGVALHVAKLVEGFHSNTKAWARFAEHVQKNVALIAQSMADQRTESSDTTNLQKCLDGLNQVLIHMSMDIKQRQRAGTVKRALAFIKDPKMIDDMQKDFDRAIQIFHVSADIHIGHDVSQILEDILRNTMGLQSVTRGLEKVGEKLGQIDMNIQESTHAATLAKLTYAPGTSWNSHLMCYPDTRKTVLGEIEQWVTNFEDNTLKRIFLLTGAPGAGKTTIAHSVSKFCVDKGWLATSFFFNREDSTRASKLFSNLTCDLAAKFASFQACISQAIDRDPSLASAGPARQFNDLIMPFASRLPQDQPIVIVLDALDEGCTKEIISVLLKDICKLPSNVMVFATTREIEDVKLLSNADHVYHRVFHHHGGQELEDAALVAQTNLRQIAMTKELEGWPSENLVKRMVERSQGLMIWVVTVCQYLEQVPDPRGDLQVILDREQPDDQGVEEKMDELYAMILLGYKWRNKTFVKGYEQVMGTILASKVPLSAQAVSALHSGIQNLPNILQILKPLLLPSAAGQPLQVLHQSLHDLLTDRAHVKEAWKSFAVDESKQSQQLALLCLQTLNKDLSNDTPSKWYIYGKKIGIPKIPENAIEEHVQYACKFWMDHILGVEKPNQQVIDALENFLDNNFSLWLELSACIGNLRDINPLIAWVNELCPQLLKNMQSLHAADTFTSLSYNLRYENRRNEALIAAELGFKLLPSNSEPKDGVQKKCADALLALSMVQSGMGMRHDALKNARYCRNIYMELAEQNPDTLNPDFARSLHNLGNMLSEMGLREEALQATQEAVEIYKELAEKNPAAFSLDLARSLANLGVMLSKMGLREEALQATQEAVEIYKKLAEKNPTTFNLDLARSLANLGVMLSKMGLREEALQATQEAIKIRKVLAEQNPAAFNSGLARSLHNLGNRLSDMGLREDALQATQEAIKIRKDLAEQNPAAFNPDLARSLYNLSIYLREMNLKVDALVAIREAIEIWKDLAMQLPDVYETDLAGALNWLSVLQGANGGVE